MADSEDKPKIIVDEDWKARAQAEKQRWAQEAAEAKSQEAAAQPQPAAADTSASASHRAAPEMPPLPPPSFAGLCQMLATQAIAALTGMSDDDTPPQPRPQEARWFIDLLGMLEEKSKGNLTPQEAQLLTGMLHELRMAFVNQPKS